MSILKNKTRILWLQPRYFSGSGTTKDGHCFFWGWYNSEKRGAAKSLISDILFNCSIVIECSTLPLSDRIDGFIYGKN